MTRPTKHPKTGTYLLRIAIPPELRDTAKQLYGVNRELRESLRTKDANTARDRAPEALARLREKLDRARRIASEAPRDPTARELAALAGNWYRRRAGAYSEDTEVQNMHGLVGLPLPEGDLYGFPDVPRWVAKAWITAALGKGSPVTKWATKATKRTTALEHYDAASVGRIICGRYPFLRAPAAAVSVAAGLDKLDRIGRRGQLLTHRLMAIEAQALTAAMSALRNSGVLALPMHDGLIVPRSGAGTASAYLIAAYSWVANRVRIKCSTEVAPEVPRG